MKIETSHYLFTLYPGVTGEEQYLQTALYRNGETAISLVMPLSNVELYYSDNLDSGEIYCNPGISIRSLTYKDLQTLSNALEIGIKRTA